MSAPSESCADRVPASGDNGRSVETVAAIVADLSVPEASIPKPEAPFLFLLPVLVASLVGSTAMFGQMFAGILLETFVAEPVFPPGSPRLSYGAPAMHLAQLVAGAAGVFGLACGLAVQGRGQLRGFGLSLVAGVLALILVTAAWRGSEAGHGYDPSDWPCFVAPFLLSVALTALSAASLAFFAVTRTLRFVASLFGADAPSSMPAKIAEK